MAVGAFIGAFWQQLGQVSPSLVRILIRDPGQRGGHPGSADWNRDASVHVLHQRVPAGPPLRHQPGCGFTHRGRSAAPSTNGEDFSAP